MKYRVKIFNLIILLMLVLVTTGCSTDESKIKVSSKDEILKYAKNKYGNANLKKGNCKDCGMYTLLDKEYNFEYTCRSEIDDFCIDASCLGIYSKRDTCNFDEKYSEYIIKKLNLKNSMDIYSYSSTAKVLLELKYSSEKAAKKDIKNIIRKIKKIDKRKYFIDYNVKVYDSNEKELGMYNIKNGKYINVYEENIEIMTSNFAFEVNGDRSDESGIKYLYYKKIQYKDVEGLKMEWLSDKTIKEDDWTVEYYFSYNGSIYFIIPDIVTVKSNEEDGIYKNHSDDEYTNYWFYDY